MAIEIRAITAEEAVDFRRAVQTGFAQRDTVDDVEWCQAAMAPFDRAYGAFDGGAIVATLRSFPTELTVPGGHAIASGALTAARAC